VAKALLRPPGLSDASSSVTSAPAFASASADAKPAQPPPTTTALRALPSGALVRPELLLQLPLLAAAAASVPRRRGRTPSPHALSVRRVAALGRECRKRKRGLYCMFIMFLSGVWSLAAQ
jgi:hypothetical protein